MGDRLFLIFRLYSFVLWIKRILVVSVIGDGGVVGKVRYWINEWVNIILNL